MFRKKALGLMLSVCVFISLVGAGCNLSTTTVSSTPPPSVPQTLLADASQAALCIVNHAGTFSDIGSLLHGDNTYVQLGLDALEIAFDLSCQQTGSTVLNLIQNQVDPQTYIYVGGEQSYSTTLSQTIDIANCGLLPESSSFQLTAPFWISVANPNRLFNDVFTTRNFPNTISGKVASYLTTHDLAGLGSLFSTGPYTNPYQPTIPGDSYLEVTLSNVKTSYVSGFYEVYSGGNVIQKRTQWTYISSMTFPPNGQGQIYSGASSKGLCTAG